MSPNMIGGLMMLTALSSCVLSLPVTPSQLENEDVKVMKCIVEALADVLSRQQHVPVSQDCLETLKTDDRLVTILRHHNFLKELQEIAVQGDQERAQLQKDDETPTAQSLQTTDEAADRSMLEALGGPGERSILAQKKNDESLEEAEDDVKRMEEESDEKRANSGEASEEEESKGGERRDAPRNKSKEKRVNEEHEEEENKRSDVFSHKQQEKGEESPRRWTKRTKALQVKKKTVQQHEVPHHSKELTEEEEEEEQKKKKRGVNHKSPEEKELQMIARRPPEERRAMEEEGSASRKSEDPEIESLAAIESELENVAQKLHELRRG
ncbi:chromogranin-A [Amphiprion ocellaris]|uniref:chromogranin-A n=1 Tax=Amphiprion ocellaris TaxID=80972 RepID=UPI00241181A8|nr:chromogranin-A [Amphiprion ocellaris]